MVALFLKEIPEMLTNLREAITAGDAHAIERAAHKLKGSVGNFAAHPAFEAALKLEVLGREGSLSNAEPVYAELEKEINASQVGDGQFEQPGSPPMKALMIVSTVPPRPLPR